jgi:hypothetical protein
MADIRALTVQETKERFPPPAEPGKISLPPR